MRATSSTRPISITPSRAARPTTASRGAARGIRIRSGAPRTYYVGIESAMPAVPGHAGAAQGAVRRPVRHGGGHQRVDRRPEFGLVVGEPAEFRFLSSTVRKTDPRRAR